MPDAFEAGDIVELKSGGPKMTVKGFDKRRGHPDPSSYECQWFGGKKLESGFFHPHSLTKIESAPQ
jgi:uncharacterized protein YodC (DUF2158 family)